MRVIGGKARGHRLKRVPGDTTRPIMDRVKENLFNVLAGDVSGSRWLDMFAGTGAVGIEALSRGAADVVFLDTARPAIRTIEANLRHTRLGAAATVVQTDALRFVAGWHGPPYDVVYVAPPQYQGLWRRALTLLDERARQLLTPEGLVIDQIDPREHEAVALQELRLTERRRYGRTLLCFYERRDDTLDEAA